jgi:hypothetical protein
MSTIKWGYISDVTQEAKIKKVNNFELTSLLAIGLALGQQIGATWVILTKSTAIDSSRIE